MEKEPKTKAKKKTAASETSVENEQAPTEMAASEKSDTKAEAITAIQTISKVAAIHAVVTDEIEEGLTPELEAIALAVKNHYGLDDAAMDEYRAELSKAIETEKAEDIPRKQVEDAVDVIYEMCDSLDNPKEIMHHIKNAREMMYVCGMIA